MNLPRVQIVNRKHPHFEEYGRLTADADDAQWASDMRALQAELSEQRAQTQRLRELLWRLRVTNCFAFESDRQAVADVFSASSVSSEGE